jgi:hypothetical protein
MDLDLQFSQYFTHFKRANIWSIRRFRDEPIKVKDHLTIIWIKPANTPVT